MNAPQAPTSEQQNTALVSPANSSTTPEARPAKVSFLPLVVSFLCLILCGLILVQIQNNTVPVPPRTAKQYIFPEGFSGKVKIYFGMDGEPELPKKDGYWVINVPFNGEVRTSTHLEWGNAVDEMYIQHHDEKGEPYLRRINFSAAAIHKTGLLGDEHEYFEDQTELTQRDPATVKRYEDNRKRLQAEMTAGKKQVAFPAYELILLRDGL